MLNDDQAGDRVAEFIAAMRPQVVQRAITDLSAANDAELPHVIHRLAGTLASYGVLEEGLELRRIDEQLRATSKLDGLRDRIDAVRVLLSGRVRTDEL